MHEEVTSAGVYRLDGSLYNPDGKFYLFTAEVPTIDVVKMQGLYKDLIENNGKATFYILDEKHKSTVFSLEFSDPNLEVFMFYTDPSMIKSIEEKPLPPKWYMKQ